MYTVEIGYMTIRIIEVLLLYGRTVYLYNMYDMCSPITEILHKNMVCTFAKFQVI